MSREEVNRVLAKVMGGRPQGEYLHLEGGHTLFWNPYEDATQFNECFRRVDFRVQEKTIDKWCQFHNWTPTSIYDAIIRWQNAPIPDKATALAKALED